jgi:hypothetical protein
MKAGQFSGALAFFEKIPDETALRVELEGLFLPVLYEYVSSGRNADCVWIFKEKAFSCILYPHFLFQGHDPTGFFA